MAVDRNEEKTVADNLIKNGIPTEIPNQNFS